MPGGVQGPGKERTMKTHTGFLLATAAVIAMALVVGAAYGGTDSHDDHGVTIELSEHAQESLDTLHDKFMDAWAEHGEDMAKLCRS